MSHQIVRLRAQRRRWALSQLELADLLGISQAFLSRLEKAEKSPDAMLLFGCQAVLGLSPRALFPGLYHRAEEAVMRAAADLDRKIAHRKDAGALAKRRLLSAMAYRARGNEAEA